MAKLKRLLWVGALLVALGALLLLAQKPAVVDIKPGSYPNCMDRDSMGVVSVGLNDPASSKPSDIKLNDTPTCTSGFATALRCKVEDIPGFGDISDLICQFASSDLRTAGVMPSTGTCKTVYVCVGTNIVGSDQLCDARSPTCN